MQADIAKTPAALRALQAMQQETLLQASLQHPNVLGLLGAVQDQSAFAGFLMPFCQGGSLETALRYSSSHSPGCCRTAASMFQMFMCHVSNLAGGSLRDSLELEVLNKNK